MKANGEQSLRREVEKWLAPGTSRTVHVTEFGRTRWGHKRYVCVETALSTGRRSLFFFRHDDGFWCVFPPADEVGKSVSPQRLMQLSLAEH